MLRLVLPLVLLAPALSAAQVTETHPDGSRASTAVVDKEGRRDGAYTAWWPGGKLLKEKAAYKDGVLHGIRALYDEKGKQVGEETWIQGRLIYPRNQAQVAAGLKQIEAEAAAWVAQWPKPTNPAAAGPADQAKALARLRQYRWLSGLAHDVVLDDRYTDCAQEGAALLAKLGKLDHHPKKPADMDEATYKKAYEGTSRGNLAQGLGDLVSAVDGWMDDSDPSNIAALGHRRWLLNPSMAAAGFGIDGKMSVVFAHDTARKDAPHQPWQAYPAPGFYPVSHFGQRHAWHVSVNPKDYQTDLKAATFRIYALDQSLRRLSEEPLTLDYDGSNGDGYGDYRNARIVRPGQPKDPPRGQKPGPVYQVVKGRSYEAVVGGLTPKGSAPSEIRFVVTFF
jgi:hypothetical protein